MHVSPTTSLFRSRGVIKEFGPVTVTSPTTAVAQVSIIGQAQFGPQTVTVQTGTETVSLTNGFGITLPPALTSFGPVSAQPGQALSIRPVSLSITHKS